MQKNNRILPRISRLPALPTFSIVLLLLGVSVISAASWTVSDPVQKTLIYGQPLDLGVAGPGQKIVIISNRESGEPSKNAANPTEALWDRVVVDNLPAGWTSEPSKLYETPFQTFITISPQAQDGDYTFTVRTVDEYDGLVPIAITANVRVSRDVLSATLSNAKESTGAQQPALFYLTLSNTGSASDIFEVIPQGLPAKWSESRRVFVPHNSALTLSYPVTPTEGGTYPFTFSITSLSSPLVHQKINAELDAQTSIWNDGKAASHGIVLFPFIAQPLYALIAVLSNLR
ncbi:hypothetical protein HY994_05600 [Candidatus Micrarchaeota archaeon]|nr:hypothetical protein [Candidatus Micrarchaeota archaeon]